jgi:hypothetical protein
VGIKLWIKAVHSKHQREKGVVKIEMRSTDSVEVKDPCNK